MCYWWYFRFGFLFKRKHFFKHFLIVDSKFKVWVFFFSFTSLCIKLLSTSCLSVSVSATTLESISSLIDKPVMTCDLFSSAVFLTYFSMLILSLPLLRLRSKSTSLSPGFCVCRPKQFDTICWELNLISGFFAFFLLIVWAYGINKCGWCLAGGRVCWLKGPHQIPSAQV